MNILLSFDVEEFDLPLEFSQKIKEQDMFEFSKQGLLKILNILDKHKIKATFFTTASFAQKYPELIKKISQTHEIASHGLSHSLNKHTEQQIQKSKQILESITGKTINGFRAPRLQKPDFQLLNKLNFKYDSSISPTYIPGRYNNYKEKRSITMKKGIVEIPISTLPVLRLPLAWLFFRTFPLAYSKIITILNKNLNFTNLYLHPWEFNSLNNFKIPRYIKTNSGDKALKKLERYIIWCRKKNYIFTTFEEFLKSS